MSEPRETRDSSLSARLKSKNEKKMQLSKSWKLKLHKRLVWFIFFRVMDGAGTASKRV